MTIFFIDKRLTKNIVNFLRKVRTGSSTIQRAFLACRDYQRRLEKAWMHFLFIRHSKIYITIYVKQRRKKNIIYIVANVILSLTLCAIKRLFRLPASLSLLPMSFTYCLVVFFPAQQSRKSQERRQKRARCSLPSLHTMTTMTTARTNT